MIYSKPTHTHLYYQIQTYLPSAQYSILLLHCRLLNNTIEEQIADLRLRHIELSDLDVYRILTFFLRFIISFFCAFI